MHVNWIGWVGVGLRYFLLLEILVLGVALWIVQGILRFLRRNPRAMLAGMNPAGTTPVIRWGSGRGIWIIVQARKLLGRYVEKYHPILFLRVQRLFK